MTSNPRSHGATRRPRTARSLGAALLAAAALPLSLAPAAHGDTASYYVDCTAGSDANSGTSTSSAWRSLSPVNARTFSAGNGIYLKRGCSWDGGLTARSSGSASAPITYAAYGTGAAPVVRNSGAGRYGNGVTVTGDYNVVDGLLVRDAGSAGVIMKPGADRNVVRNTEVTAAGMGIEADGQYNLITRNSVHDLRMIVNTQGGDDDYGATCFWLQGANNEVSYNRGVNCKAPSYDYGSDGGFVEIWQSGDNSFVHHNYSQNTAGYFELGGSGSAQNVRVAYNVIRDWQGGPLLCPHDNGTFTIAYTNFRFENNTAVTDNGGQGIGCVSSLTPSKVLFRNNVFSGNFQMSGGGGNFTHQNNLYNLSNGVGYALGSGEKVGAPAFVNRAAGDYHLTSGSPAVDAGLVLGYSRDFDDRQVAAGAAPDMGAFEYAAASTAPAPAPTPAPVPAPTTWTSLNDATVGTAAGQFSYSGSWTLATGAGKYQGDDHYANAANSSYTVRFNGVQARLYVATAPWHGQAAVSVDGGPETVIDCYSSAKADQVLKFTSAVLPAGAHTLRVRITGTRNGASTGTYVTADRVDVAS